MAILMASYGLAHGIVAYLDEDGSFTLQTLVTDVGSEILEVVWNDTYAMTLPVTLPSIPQHIQLNSLKLPINFIAVNIQNIFGKNLSEASVMFLKKQQEMEEKKNIFLEPFFSTLEQLSSHFPGINISEGMYESPELPNGEYVIIARKDGYMQEHYPVVPVQSGINVSDVTIVLSHLVTVKGTGSGRQSVVQTIKGSGIRVDDIKNVTPVSHSGSKGKR